MIGFYDYTVIVTYLGLFSTVFGMTQAIEGRFRTAILCLAISGLCDMFDGRIARTKKNRTDDEKLFGVQIDSLCDVICFGVFPVMICYMLGVKHILGTIAIAYYCICSVIRLGFFNVLETNRQRTEDGANKYYHGLPITSIAVILPLIFMLSFLMSESIFRWLLIAVLFVVGTLFIIDFTFKKPSAKTCNILIIIVGCAAALILLFSEYRVVRMRNLEGPLIEHIIDTSEDI